MNNELGDAWTASAEGYDNYFVPRFSPWVERCVATLSYQGDLPEGHIISPCCGTGVELQWVAERFPGRPLLGVDLSEGMIQRALSRLESVTNDITLRVGDATDTSKWPTAAALVSSFGLQQMDFPAQALANWVDAMAPQAVISVVFWPSVLEDDGPFSWLREEIQNRLGQTDASWEDRIQDSAADAGGEWIEDQYLRFPMRHDNAKNLWDAFVHSGPLRALIERQDQTFGRELRDAFLSRAPEGTIEHEPRARHLLIRKTRS